ncbi:MAG: CoA transferase [Caldilineales bacterium]|nr:CoA transferase [Caldilineales bacterium]
MPPTAPPLTGLRVLDLAPLLPGAFVTMWLGDLGADVIKVEPPEANFTRLIGDLENGLGPYFAAVQRNKRSLVLDLKTAEGQAALFRLAATADIVVEGFRPGVAARLRADYNTLRQANPRLIYCSITGFGQDGPYRDAAGHDLTYTALAGLLAFNRGEGSPPHPMPVQVADLGGGAMPALTAILAALYHRERTGEGQYIDVAMLDGTLAWLYYLLPLSRRPDLEEAGVGMLTGSALCYNVYETADGRYLAVAALEPHFWAEVCQAIGRPDLLDYGLNPEPGAAERLAELRSLFRSRPLAEWLALLDPVRTACGPVNTLEEMLRDPQVRHRGVIVEGETPQIAFPARLSATPAGIRRPPPRLGEHTEEVLGEIGMAPTGEPPAAPPSP